MSRRLFLRGIFEATNCQQQVSVSLHFLKLSFRNIKAMFGRAWDGMDWNNLVNVSGKGPLKFNEEWFLSYLFPSSVFFSAFISVPPSISINLLQAEIIRQTDESEKSYRC